jgi:hypothetical protein
MSLLELQKVFYVSVAMACGTASFAQDVTTYDDCFGLDLTAQPIALATVLKRSSDAFRAQAGQVKTLSGCKNTVQDFHSIADLKEINEVLPRVDAEIKAWNDGRITLWPQGDSIHRLNTLLSEFTTDENFIVDDGFYIGSAQTLLQVSNFRFYAEITGAFLEVQPNAELYAYIQELSTASLGVSQALGSYQQTLANFSLSTAFRYCMDTTYFNNGENTYNFGEKYRLQTILAQNGADIDPVVESTGICSLFYTQALPETQIDSKTYINKTLSYLLGSPASYNKQLQ